MALQSNAKRMRKVSESRMGMTIRLLLVPLYVVSFPLVAVEPRIRRGSDLWTATANTSYDPLPQAIEDLNAKLSILAKGNVKIGISETHGLGLLATKDIQKGESCVSIPFGTPCEITADTAKAVFVEHLPRTYDSWTGDVGLMALQLLNEMALMEGAGIGLKQRTTEQTELMKAWLTVLTITQSNDQQHPLLWNEDDQEVLQSSTTNKIYRRLDDLEEDFQWLEENVFSKDRETFPLELAQQQEACFSLNGFKWAMSVVQSRSFFLDGKLRLIPVVDFCNHQDTAVNELTTKSTGMFGGSKGATILASQDTQSGREVFVSYGPKSASDYLLEHGFIAELCWKNAIAEISTEMDPEDRFYDDKLDILEYETYELAPMDPVQSFDIVANGPPDPALLQFLRLRQLGQYDAFLLESIFRKEVWGFMATPVSESNELAVIQHLIGLCRDALDEFAECPSGGRAICAELRQSETFVLERMITILEQEKEGLDLKEYYQERRLKDLGLDSVWTPEDDLSEADLSYGQTRAPGGADYDW